MIAISGEMIRPLRVNNEMRWSSVIEQIRNRYIFTENQVEAARNFISIMMGGMGSFNDLILHKDGMPLSEESDVLDDLRRMLFYACRDVISRMSEDSVLTVSAQLIKLLRDNNETRWSSLIEMIRNHYISTNDKAGTARDFISTLTMEGDSFKDFLIYKDHDPLLEENDALNVLKDKLFHACQNVITKNAKDL